MIWKQPKWDELDEGGMYSRSKNKRLYNVWASMKSRCLNKNNPAYPRYGGRGITICDEWMNNFSSFARWAYENGYMDDAKRGDCTLDRIDSNGNYEPLNCRWVSFNIQNNNRRDNVLIEHNGVTHTMAEWSRIVGISTKVLHYRLKHGYSVDEALSLPLNSYKNGQSRFKTITLNGETHSLSEWSRITGICVSTISYRLKRGFTNEECLSKERLCK